MRKLTKAVSVAAAVAMTATCFSTTAFADDTFKIGGIGPITGGDISAVGQATVFNERKALRLQGFFKIRNGKRPMMEF